MGFDAWFFARIDYKDKEKRLNDKELEFVWRPSTEHLGNDVQIFTHTLYAHYSAPHGFDFDSTSNDKPWINNDKSKDYNSETEAQALISQLEERADHYLTDDIFVLFGDDFRWMNAY